MGRGGIFLWDPSTYSKNFRRKPQKTLNGKVDMSTRIEPDTSYLLVLRAKPFGHCCGLYEKYERMEFSWAL